jgi:cytoskeletal protein RodZ
VELFDSQANQAVATRQDDDLLVSEPADDLEVYRIHKPEDGQSLVQTIIMIIGGIILVVLLVLFARWVYHKVHNTDNAANTSGTLQINEPSSSSNPKPNTTTSPTPSSTPQTTPQNNALPNNGPGNVIALFAGATLATAGLHYIISVRRFNKSGY